MSILTLRRRIRRLGVRIPPGAPEIRAQHSPDQTASGRTCHPFRHSSASLALRILPVLALLAAVVVSPPRDSWISSAAPDRAVIAAQTAAQADAMIHAQAVTLGCTSQTPSFGRVAVRNAKGFDRGVVRVESFDAAYADAKAGRVWVVGYCS